MQVTSARYITDQTESCLELAGQNASSVDVARVRLKTLTVTQDLCSRSSRHRRHQQAVTYTIPAEKHLTFVIYRNVNGVSGAVQHY